MPKPHRDPALKPKTGRGEPKLKWLCRKCGRLEWHLSDCIVCGAKEPKQ